MLTSKRYDLEGFAEYAHNLSDCQTFHKNEAKHIDYVLRVHGTLKRNGVKVPHSDVVRMSTCQYGHFLGQRLHVYTHIHLTAATLTT